MDNDRIEAVRMLIDNVTQLALMVPINDANELVRLVDHDNAFGPILDPTWWRQNADNIGTRLDMFAAFATYRAAIGKIQSSVQARSLAVRGDVLQTGADNG